MNRSMNLHFQKYTEQLQKQHLSIYLVIAKANVAKCINCENKGQIN